MTVTAKCSPGEVLALLRRLGQLTRTNQPPDVLIREVIERLPGLIGVERVSLLMLHEAGTELAAFAQIGLPREFRVIRNLEAAPVVQWVMQHREPLIVDDIATDKRFAGKARRTSYQGSAFVSLPLIDEDRVMGVLNLTERHDGGHFLPEEIETLTLFADQLASTMRSAMLRESLRRQELRLQEANAELKERLNELRLLYRLGRSITSVVEIEALIRLIVKQLPVMLKVQRASIVLREAESGRLYILEAIGLDRRIMHRTFLRSAPISEMVIERRKPLLVNDMAADKRFAHMMKDDYKTRAFISIPLFHKEDVIGVLSVSDRRDGSPFTSQDLRLLTIFGSQLAVSVANIRLVEQLRKTDRLVEELRIARTIQTQFLPIMLPEVPGLDVAVKFEPAETVSGDFYTFVEPKDGSLTVIVGDVAGKGIPAALLTVLAISQFHEAGRTLDDPGLVMKHSHRVLCQYSQGIQYITSGMLCLRPRTGQLKYCLAGHPFFLHYQAATRAVVELKEADGLPLGLYEDIDDYTVAEAPLAPGDRLLMYTDGIIDARDRDNNAWGKVRLRDAFRMLAQNNAPAERIASEIFGSLKGYSTGAAQYDDMTLICIGVNSATDTRPESVWRTPPASPPEAG